MKYIKLFLVAIFIIFEDLIWHRIGQPIYEAVKSLGIMARFRSWVAEVKHRYALLAIFLAPFIIMEIVGLLSLKAFAVGAIILGITLYIFKVLLTIPVVIIFNTAETELRSFYVIDWGYCLILKIKQSETFLTIKQYVATIKAEIVQTGRMVKQQVREFFYN
jgi:hypothetical protein